MLNPIPYGKQHITKQDEDAVVKALYSDFLTQGPSVAEFETKFASYVGSKYAVAVSNGTAALHLCALALGVNENSRVITSPITFVASANCILYCNGTIEFADIDPVTATLDIQVVKKMLESKPKGYYSGLIPVDFAGYPVNMEEFRKLADEHQLWIIEDACHAPGAYFTNSSGEKQKSGNGRYADLSIFSFHPVKHIATGEGGMITTNNQELYSKLLRFRTHGIVKDPLQLLRNDGGWYYEMHDLGFNYRIPDLLCALGTSQLQRADENLKKRQEIANRYDEAFNAVTDVTPLLVGKDGIGHAYHLYVIKTKERLGLYNYLRERNIFAQVHYIPVYQMPYYRKMGYKDVKCTEAEDYYASCLSLPIYPTLTRSEQEFVIQSIINFTKGI